jgi:hypothetical protein
MFNFRAKFLAKSTTAATSPEEVHPAVESLNGFPVQSLESFVKTGTAKKADDAEDEKEEEDDKKEEDKEEDEPKPKPKKKDKKDEEFGLGAKTRPISDEEMQEYAGRIKETDKNKLDPYTMPYIHNQNIKIVDGSNNEYDLKALKANIMKRPSALLKKNEKMKHSDGTATQYYNIGLPALKGLAVNEQTGEFVIVDTCPGSGACKTFCYAMRGSYVMFKDVSMKQTQTLNFLLNKPKSFAALLKAEIATASIRDEDIEVVIRWHDAGDFFSPQYTELAFDVARAFPDITFYAYTKIAAVANGNKPANFIINFSEGALPTEQNQVNMTQIKHSVVVPQKMFWDLIVTKGAHTVKKDGQVQFKDGASWDAFRERLVEKYKIKKDTILIYNQYMRMKSEDLLGSKPKWNVVVPPGGGDTAANDPLVLGTYLMWH